MTAQVVRSPLPAPLLAPILAGSLLALAGGYWDDAWHTERGRDEFLIAPHIAIYGGIALAGAALALWALLAVRAEGRPAVLRYRPLALAVLAVVVTLASGPIDNAWHLAFGRDAVIWSPPHTLGIAGTAALGVALLIELAQRDAHWARLLRPAAGAFVLAALCFLVVEYETDVPQFDPLWYLPVLALASSLALAIVRAVGDERWSASQAALVHLAFIALVCLLLLALGYDTPKLPLLLGPAVVLDLASRRGAAAVPTALAYVAALYLLYVPSLNWLGEGVRLDADDILLGLPLAAVAVTLALACVFGSRFSPPRPAAVASALLGIALLFPAGARAHDPGQGDEAGTMRLDARVAGRTITLDARPRSGCEVEGAQLVARRAGDTHRARLDRTGCRFSGALEVDEDGRWFVYAELDRGGDTVESWLPVKVGERGGRFLEERRYAYVVEEQAGGVAKAIADVLLYLGVLGLLLAMVAVVRNAAWRRPAMTSR